MTMKKWLFFVLLMGALPAFSVPPSATGSGKDSLIFYDARKFDMIGRYHSENNYARLPQKFQGTVRESVWSLSRNSAGISIRFRTNSPTIAVRCVVLNDANLPHMPATGVKGVDLYGYNGHSWQYVKTGFPRKKQNEYTLLSDGDGVSREYLLNLPLYDGVESLEIGITTRAAISPATDRLLLENKPVVYYGTSIAQGGCASRPGLAYTNILARKLDRAFINLGFSGNGTIETSVGEAMAEVDAALYVIDCNPNTKDEVIYERTLALVDLLRKLRPHTPILLVEGFLDESNAFKKNGNQNIVKKRQELKRAYETLAKSGIRRLYYLEGDGLIGKDHEGTVDGLHPNDIGMMRMADALLPVIKKIL